MRWPFPARETRTVGVVGAVVSLRLLGLSLVLPVLARYGAGLTGSDLLVGLAVGGYAATMALLQIPLGALSDRVGRRPVLAGGMLVFALGSLAAAEAATIEALVAARLLQGSGAVSGVALASVGDAVPRSRRSTAMALVGVPVGGAFSLGLVAGPYLGARFGGVPFLFQVTAAMAAAGALLALALPELDVEEPMGGADALRGALANPEARKVAVGSFATDLSMTAFFFLFPLLGPGVGVGDAEAWTVLLPMVAVGAVAMGVGSRLADRGHVRGVAAANLLLLAAGAALAWTAGTLALFVAGGILYFSGYSTLEALLPSLMTTVAEPGQRGGTTGLHQTAQSAGGALGAPLAGVLSGLLPALAAVVAVLAVAGAGAAWAVALPAEGGRWTEAAGAG
jgi:predicted MFS family arabinose efflux permease